MSIWESLGSLLFPQGDRHDKMSEDMVKDEMVTHQHIDAYLQSGDTESYSDLSSSLPPPSPPE